MGRLNRAVLVGIALMLVNVSALGAEHDKFNWWGWWLTAPQQGQRAFEQAQYARAAALYQDPMRIGSALYRDGEFESAAATFARVNTPEAAFNQGTALVMHGKYAQAIEAYDRALAARPDWPEAQENRAIAELRMQRLDGSDKRGTEASEIGADEIVFDLKKTDNNNQDEIELEAGGPMSDEALRALWLRKSQTSPAVFLKAKFAAQLAYENEAEKQK